MKRASLLIAIGVFCVCSVFGQSEKSKKDEIPTDLLIKLSSVSRRPSYSITIDRNGTWIYEGFRGSDPVRLTGAEVRKTNEERLKSLGQSGGKVPIDQLSEGDIRELIADFEALDFFNLDAKYSFGQVNPETGESILCFPHARKDVIFIKYGGREKAVENYSGCVSETSKKLTALAKRIEVKLNLR